VLPCTLIEKYNILKEPAASATLKIEVPGSSKPLAAFYETTWCHVKKTAIFTFIAIGISNVTNIFSLGSKNKTKKNTLGHRLTTTKIIINKLINQ
jgi:hypothetical protein